MVNSLSVVIPCYNEWKLIRGTVENALQALWEWTQIIVSDQSDNDEIYNSLKDLIKSKSITHTKSPWKSRAQTMNHWARLTKNDIVIFLHADTTLPLTAWKILSTMDRKKYVFWWFYKQFTTTTRGLTLMNRWTNTLIKYMLRWDNVHFIDRKIFNEVGQYKEIRLFEDFELLKTMRKYNKKHNKKLFIIRDHVLTSPRAFTKSWAFKRVLINTYVKVLYILWVSDKRIQEIYYWRKF